MAWTAARTWVSGEIVSAATMNSAIRDNLLALNPLNAVAWTDYSASFAWTMSTSGTVTDTVNYAKYWQVGKTVVFTAKSTVSSISSPVGTCTFSLPVTAAAASAGLIGAGYIVDDSLQDLWIANVFQLTATTVELVFTSATAYGVFTGAQPIATLASPDNIGFTVIYEAA